MSTNQPAQLRDNQNLVVWRGDALRIRVPVARLNGTPVDISGAQNIIWSAAKEAGGPAVVTKEYSGGQGVIITTDNEFLVTLEPEDTRQFTDTVYWPQYQSATDNRIDRRSIAASYYHEARVVRESGEPYTVVSGRLFVRTSLIEEASNA